MEFFSDNTLGSPMGTVQSIASQRPGLVAVLSSGAVGVASAALAAFQQECFYHEVSTPATRLVEQQHLEPTFFGWGTARLVTEWKEENYDVFESELDLHRVLAFSVASLALATLVGAIALACSEACGQALAAHSAPQKGCDLKESEETEAPIDFGQESQMTCLVRAVADGNAAEVESLVERGTNLDLFESEGRTPLATAVGLGKGDMVELLVKLGADINFVDVGGWTPLASAVVLDKGDMVELLVKLGADVNLLDGRGWTPLKKAIGSRNGDMVKLLLKLGADINFVDVGGWTPLASAVVLGKGDMVELLVKLGADVNLLDGRGWTPLMAAICAGNWSMVKLLKRCGANGRVMAIKRFAHAFDLQYTWEERGKGLSSNGFTWIVWARELIKAIDLLTARPGELIPSDAKRCLLSALNYVVDYDGLSEQKRMERFNELRVKILGGGYKDHLICFVLTKNFLDIANRGSLAETEAIESYSVNEARAEEILKLLRIADKRSDCERLLHELRSSEHLKRTKDAPQEKGCPLQRQGAGTCSYTSLLAAVWSLLVHEMGVEKAKAAFRAISQFYQLRSVDKLLRTRIFKRDLLKRQVTVKPGLSKMEIQNHAALFRRISEELAAEKDWGEMKEYAQKLQMSCSDLTASIR